MINFDDVTKGNINQHNPNWAEIPDHAYRILIVGGSESGKTNALLNLINHELKIHVLKIHLKQNFSF